MLGLKPMPERTDLKPQITGKIIREGIEVWKLHFQSMPGLYVTANLYLPVDREGAIPGVLYLPGHTIVEEDGISYGPKVANHYQTHPVWYARNGIAALIIVTLHGGEIQGIHHGTSRYGRWWWFNREYTPGGVQAWNAIRALDYLESLDEVVAKRYYSGNVVCPHTSGQPWIWQYLRRECVFYCVYVGRRMPGGAGNWNQPVFGQLKPVRRWR